MPGSLLLIVERDHRSARIVYSRPVAPDYALELHETAGGEPVDWSEWLVDLYRAGAGQPLQPGQVPPDARAWALGDGVFALLVGQTRH